MNSIVIDAFFRFSAITLLLLVAIVILRDLRHSKTAVYLWFACITVIALFLGLTPDYIKPHTVAKVFFRFLDIPHLVFIWLFALALFQKDFKLTTFHLLVGILYSASIFYVRLYQFEIIKQIPSWWIAMVDILSVVLMLHMITITHKGRNDDLVKKRRKSRLYFVFLIAVIGIGTALIEFINVSFQLKMPLATIKLLTIWPAIVWLGFWLLSIKSTKFSFDEINETTNENLNHRDKTLYQKLEKEMVENKAYLKNGLTISSLAQRLGVSPHRLRDFINQTLGHENFSTYTNTYRIQAIKKAFSNIDNEHIPILTIAMQYGFNSLSPFNRAFKTIEGITPSEYRQNVK